MTYQSRWGRSVQRISLTWVIETFRAVDELDNVKAGIKLWSIIHVLWGAKNQLDALFQQSVYAWHLRVSREKAGELSTAIDGLTGNASNEYERVLNNFDAWSITNAKNEFVTVFKSELSTLPAFLVSEKEGYDVNFLVDAGTVLFPKSLSAKVPEAVIDALQAGKALAFELATACGFHVFRVTESVLKRYWDIASGGKARPKLETIGNYAAELKAGKHGEEKIWEALSQLSKLHRNPLIHPEVILSVEEAINIVGMARSVTGAMLAVMPDAPLTTATPTVTP